MSTSDGFTSLAELKAINDKTDAEIAKKNAPPEIVDNLSDDEVVETPEVEEVGEIEEVEEESTDEDSDEDGDEPKETEDWMQSDEPEEGSDDEGEEEKKFTDSDAGKLRRKMQGKLKERDEENEALKKRIEELEKGTKPAQKTIERPKESDFDDQDKYLEALADWKWEVKEQERQSQANAEQKKTQAEQFKAKINKDVDDHYVRAHTLTKKSGISEAAFQSADKKVREAVDEVFNGSGDAITEVLISNMGEGSEKVMYHLGVNSAKREQLKNLLKEDKNGIKASFFLGGLVAELNAPAKRVTKAPAPGSDVAGDKPVNKGVREFKKAYDEAARKGDAQKRYDIKKAAKAKGVDTSGW